MYQRQIDLTTSGRGIIDITGRVDAVIHDSGVQAGLCHVFVLHTSASLILSENADPDVLLDLETFMSRTVPDGDPGYVHTAEGPDDMPAHVRSILTQSGLTLPVTAGRCGLGTWQAIYLWEHRHRGHRRHLTVTVQGDG